MILRIVLGTLYLAMAAGQLASWPAMPAILGAYRAVPPEALPWLTAALAGAELLAGVWLVARPRSPAWTPVWLFTAVAVLWTALGVQAYARGLPVDNCGCFGRYLTQPLTPFTLAQDGLLLAYAALLVRASIRARRTADEQPAEPVITM